MGNEIKHINDDDFTNTIASGVTLVDFFATWCGPCRMLTPILDALVKEFGVRATIAKLDVDHAPKTANLFGISAVPTIILFKDGKEVTRFTGLKDFETLKKAINSAL